MYIIHTYVKCIHSFETLLCLLMVTAFFYLTLPFRCGKVKVKHIFRLSHKESYDLKR